MDQRAAIETRIAELRRAQKHVDVDQSMTAVTELLLAMPSAQLSEAGAKARGNAYIIALSDLPSFAVIEACHRWLCAEAGLINDGKEPRRPNYGFAPSAPELRLVAAPIAEIVSHQASWLGRLLGAKVVPEPEVIPDSAEMKARLRGLGLDLTEPKKRAEEDA